MFEKYNSFEEGYRYPDEKELQTPPDAVKRITHDGRKDILPFLHDVTLTAHNGRIYEAWYNSTSAEICGSSLIRGRFSDDGGETWSEPFCIVGEMNEAEEHYVPADFFVHNDQVYALITTMSGKNITVDLRLYTPAEDPMAPWKLVSVVGSGFICNTTPVEMDNGNTIVGAWMPMKDHDPAFPCVLISQGDSIEQPWRCVFLFDPLHPLAPRIRCPETTVAVFGEMLIAYVRNDEGPSYVFISHDYGEHWSAPMLQEIPIGNCKIYAGVLSNGRPYLIYNQERGYFVRTLYVMAVGDKGSTKFNKVYKLFEGHDETLDRGRTWFYPSVCEQDGSLYVGATLQEPTDVRSVAIIQIPIESL